MWGVLFLPYEFGGLKVVNVGLKCKALLAKSVVFITDGQYKARITPDRMPGMLHRTISLLFQQLRT